LAAIHDVHRWLASGGHWEEMVSVAIVGEDPPAPAPPIALLLSIW